MVLLLDRPPSAINNYGSAATEFDWLRSIFREMEKGFRISNWLSSSHAKFEVSSILPSEALRRSSGACQAPLKLTGESKRFPLASYCHIFDRRNRKKTFIYSKSGKRFKAKLGMDDLRSQSAPTRLV